jgi:WD domain, G-beta repeat
LTFSQHAPLGSLLAVGSGTSANIIDTRLLQNENGGLVMTLPDAHVGQVTCLEFNTFVPYWLASAGDDGTIKMWDIRYLKGNTARINAHYNTISSIAWSNTHCDIISSCSTDRSFKTWNFNADQSTSRNPWRESMVACPGSEYENGVDGPDLIIGSKMIGSCNSFRSPVLSVVADPLHADCFLTATALGVVSSHTIKPRIQESLLTHRYENLYEKNVESAIQCRNLNEAYETMIRLSRTEFAKDPTIADHATELIELCTKRPPIPAESWELGHQEKHDIDLAREELRELSYGLPPNFASFPQWSKSVSDFVYIQFDLVLLRHSITSEINRGNWEIIIQKEKVIMSGMELDDEFLDMDTIGIMIEQLLVHRYMKGISMGLALGQLLADVPKFKFEALGEIMSLFVCPTVYDTAQWIRMDLDIFKQTSNARQAYMVQYLQHLKDSQASAGPQGMAAIVSKPVVGKQRRPTLTRAQRPHIAGPGGNNEYNQKNARKLIKDVMGDGKRALPMVSLELRLIKLIETPPLGDMNEAIIAIMQNVLTDSGVQAGGAKTKIGVVPFERTISVLTNRMYLNALVQTKRYEEYYGVVITIVSVS